MGTKAWCVLLGLVLLGAPAEARRYDDWIPPPRGLSFGARLGYGIPFGKIADSSSRGADLRNGFSGVVPLQLDAGYRVNPYFYAGAYFQFGFGIPSSDTDGPCPTGAGTSCFGYDLRFGLSLELHPAPFSRLGPWVGLGAGYETFTINASKGSMNVDFSARGFELVHLEGGLDLRLAAWLRVGPFVSFSVGQYATASIGNLIGQGTTISADIDKKAFHEWLILGVRSGFDL